MAASAAYHAACACDEIYAVTDQSEIGSIGVMMTLPKDLAKNYKKWYTELYSDDSPDKNGTWRDYIQTGDTDVFKKDLTESDEYFMAIVSENRNLKGTEAQRKKTLSGGMFYAKEAKRRGLIDGVQDMNYIMKRITTLIKNRA